MCADEPKLLVYFDGEEHLVRRLGAAVISCWNDLDPAMRSKLVERAKRVLDDESDDRLDDHLQRFITVHDAVSDRGHGRSA